MLDGLLLTDDGSAFFSVQVEVLTVVAEACEVLELGNNKEAETLLKRAERTVVGMMRQEEEFIRPVVSKLLGVILHNLAYLNVRLGRNHVALRYMEQVEAMETGSSKQPSKNPQTHYMLGVIRLALKDHNAAIVSCINSYKLFQRILQSNSRLDILEEFKFSATPFRTQGVGQVIQPYRQ